MSDQKKRRALAWVEHTKSEADEKREEFEDAIVEALEFATVREVAGAAGFKSTSTVQNIKEKRDDGGS